VLERIDVENVDDLVEVLKELKLEPYHAPLVFTLEVLIGRLKSARSDQGAAQLSAQIANIMKDLMASKESGPASSAVLSKYKK